MIGSGGQWGLQMGLAPHERQGQYQGFAGLGFSVHRRRRTPGRHLALRRLGETGWLVLAAFMVVIALVSVPGGALGARLAGAVRRDDALRLTRRPSGPRDRRGSRRQRRRTATVSTLMDWNGGPSDLKSSPPPLTMCCTTSSPESTCPMRE